MKTTSKLWFLAPAVLMVALFLASPAHAADHQMHPIEFFHEQYGVPQLGELRREYDFDEYVGKGRDEFQRMVLLQQWVFQHIPYGGAQRYVHLRNSLEILARAGRGEVFWCNNFAAVFMQAAVSLGWTARYVFFRRPNGDTHVTNDIWSNQYRKWILLDATWNIHIEKDGVPLSVPEIRREWRKNNGADLVYIYGAGDRRERYSATDLPIRRDESMLWHWWPVDEKWISFTYEVAYLMRNDLFSYRDGDGAYIWGDIVIIRDALNENDKSWEFRRYPAVGDLRTLYHDLNRTDIRRIPFYTNRAEGGADSPRERPPGRVRLSLEAFGPYNYTPNFDCFLVSVDGGPWRETPPLFTFVVQPTGSVVRARVRNKFGVLGPLATRRVYP